jgi:hypothetical protein
VAQGSVVIAKPRADLHYKGSRVHKIAGDKMIVGGDISAKQDGSGGESIFGEPFEPESVERKHDRAGILSMEATSVDPQRRVGLPFRLREFRVYVMLCSPVRNFHVNFPSPGSF